MTNKFRALNPILSAILLIALLVGLVMANLLFIRRHPVEKKFLTPWLGMRTFLELGSDPYAESAAQRTQLLYYGKLAESGQDPLFLNQTFATEILYFPLALINDYTTARVVWMVLLEILLIGSVYLCLLLFEWKLPVIIAVEFSILAVFGTQAFIPLLDNDQIILIFILLLIGLVGLQKGFDELSGAAFALALFQPSVTGIVCLMAFWWAIRNQRKRVLWGGLMTWGFLLLLSFGLFPGWFISFFHAFRAEYLFINYQSSFGVLSDLWPAIGIKVASVLSIGILIILILEWRAASNKNFKWFLWVASLTLAMYPLVGIPTFSANNIVLLIPLSYILKVIAERIGGRNRWLFIGFVIWLIFLGGWGMVLSMQDFADTEAFMVVNFFVPSLLLTMGMYWIRWWATRPPRIWLDNIGREQS